MGTLNILTEIHDTADVASIHLMDNRKLGPWFIKVSGIHPLRTMNVKLQN